jgi:hypothetical protein
MTSEGVPGGKVTDHESLDGGSSLGVVSRACTTAKALMTVLDA